MPVLLASPPQFYADHHEVPAAIRAQAKVYQNQILTALSAATPALPLSNRDFAGVQLFNWGASFDGILVTALVYQKGQGFGKEWLRVARLIRKQDCAFLGGFWQIMTPDAAWGVLADPKVSLAQVGTWAGRSFRTVSPVKVDFHDTLSDPRVAVVWQTMAQEALAQSGIPIVASADRYFCKVTKLGSYNFPQKEDYPARPHNLLELRIADGGAPIQSAAAQGSVKPITKVSRSCTLTYSAYLTGAVFGNTPRSVGQSTQGVPCDFPALAKTLAQKTDALLSNLASDPIHIVGRRGAWVYLDKGRAYGLGMGSRLVGPRGEGLHVIRYDPGFEGQPDVAVAFVRHESKESPLKKGDVVRIDQTVYPQ